MTNKIREFNGKYRFLSNFYICDIPYKNRIFPSSEHAFMSEKNDSNEWKDLCAYGGLSCKEIKQRSYEVKLIPNWDNKIKYEIMREILRIKFKVHKNLRQELILTGNSILEEGNTWGDMVWGINIKTGRGRNALGIILMKIREEIIDEEKQTEN